MAAYKNSGLFFNKHYFEKNLDFNEVLELLNEHLDKNRRKDLNKKYEARFARENKDKLFDATLPASNLYITTFKDNFDRIELTTVYPGLLIGSGYPHESSVIGELKLGFHFDYTTGLPVIPGSSIKGVLRDAFEKMEPDTVWLLTDGIFMQQQGMPLVAALIRELNADNKVRVNTIGFHNSGRKNQKTVFKIIGRSLMSVLFIFVLVVARIVA